MRSLIQIRIKKLNGSINIHATSIFKDPNVTKHVSYLHEKYIVVSVDKSINKIFFVCKTHYINCLINELGLLGIENSLGNSTYTLTTLSQEEILDNHRYVLCSFGISTKDKKKLDLPSLYWIHKLRKCPYKQQYIGMSSKCSTKPPS